jgi:hypothetical protein
MLVSSVVKEVSMQLLPDPDNRAEMWMVIQFVGGMARANGWVFLGILLLLFYYAVARIAYAVLMYLFHLYQERAFTPSPYRRWFRIALGSGIVVLIVGLFMAMQEGYTHYEGIIILCCGFGVFSVVSLILDWYFGRAEQAETPELESVTLDDVVAWQSQVNEAYDAGLMTRR